MHCPKCVSVSLKPNKANRTEIVVDACARCKGVWFDADELNEILNVAAKELKPPKSAKFTPMTCPRCRVPLKAFHYPQTFVEIDMCEQCAGLWIYPNEVKEIKLVREKLRKKGELQKHAPLVGFRGDVIAWINSAIERLSDFE